MNQFKWLSLIFLLILSLSLVTTVQGQGGQGDDGGSMDQDQQDNAPELSDPNSVAPPNKQGYGVNIKTGLTTKAATKPMKIDNTLPTPIGEQSILAIQQFAVLVNHTYLHIPTYLIKNLSPSFRDHSALRPSKNIQKSI